MHKSTLFFGLAIVFGVAGFFLKNIVGDALPDNTRLLVKWGFFLAGAILAVFGFSAEKAEQDVKK
jgi:hypothetical protein